jgi:hypothetical protein
MELAVRLPDQRADRLLGQDQRLGRQRAARKALDGGERVVRAQDDPLAERGDVRDLSH